MAPGGKYGASVACFADISVGQYILIIMLMRFAGGLLVSLFVFAMFKYLRSGMSVIISCVLFIVLPLALVAFGVTNGAVFSV